MENVPLSHIIILSSALFFIGIYGFLSRRNLITVLISTELVLNSVNINFVAFNKYLYPNTLDGVFFTMFTIIVAVAEVSLAMAIIINLYRKFHTVDIDQTTNLKY